MYKIILSDYNINLLIKFHKFLILNEILIRLQIYDDVCISISYGCRFCHMFYCSIQLYIKYYSIGIVNNQIHVIRTCDKFVYTVRSNVGRVSIVHQYKETNWQKWPDLGL